jgi:hypothetical protein
LAFRYRLEAGATVEPGRFRLEKSLPVDEAEELALSGRLVGFDTCGIEFRMPNDLEPKESPLDHPDLEPEETITPVAPVVAMPSKREKDQPESEETETSAVDEDLVNVFREILREYHRGISPVEDFIWGLVVIWGACKQKGRSLTPQQIQQDYEKFCEDFEDSIETAKRMLEQYPDLVCPKPRELTPSPAGA